MLEVEPKKAIFTIRNVYLPSARPLLRPSGEEKLGLCLQTRTYAIAPRTIPHARLPQVRARKAWFKGLFLQRRGGNVPDPVLRRARGRCLGGYLRQNGLLLQETLLHQERKVELRGIFKDFPALRAQATPSKVAMEIEAAEEQDIQALHGLITVSPPEDQWPGYGVHASHCHASLHEDVFGCL